MQNSNSHSKFESGTLSYTSAEFLQLQEVGDLLLVCGKPHVSTRQPTTLPDVGTRRTTPLPVVTRRRSHAIGKMSGTSEQCR